jgi:PERQ amino acid-rich with GYF domain-containing protein
MPGFALQDHTSIFGERRPIGHEFPVNTLINEYQTALQQQQGPSFGNVVRDRDFNFNSYAFNNSPVSHDTWIASNIHASSAFGNNRDQGSERLFSSLNTQTSVHPNQIQAHTEGNHQEPFPTIFNQDMILNNDSLGDHNGQSPPTDLHPLNYGHYNFSGQPFHNAQEIPPSRDLDESSLRPVNTFGFRNIDVDTVASQSPRNISPALPTQSPWEVLPDPSINQRSATVNTIPQLLANLDAQPVASTSQHSPWHRVDQNPTFIPQISGPQVPGSLTTGSLGQHPQHEEASDAMNKLSLGSLAQKRDNLPAPDSAPTEPAIIRASARTPSNQQSSPDQTPSGEPAPVPVVQKVAWAKEEEGKRKKGSTALLNIREIQEAEVKKIESRKAAERQKDRSARATSTMDIKEDHQPFTTSWGLPTSQAGARGNIATREPLVATAQAPPSTHVWTTPLKQPIAKKTMKEIQEEEETRKRLVAKETFTPAVPKKPHAETTKPTTTLFASSSNNAWTTVGPSGKTSAVLTSTLRPSALPSSGSAVSAAPRVSSSPVQKTPPAPTLKTRPSTNKPDTLNETPSHEFLKWLSDSLKGLNSSVNGV